MTTPGRAAVEEAARRLGSSVRRTPVLTVTGDELGLGAETEVHLKLEQLQHSGSFKARGALHAALVARVEHDDLDRRGLLAASGGNHGAAVAWAAQRLGVRADIFVPTIANEAKVARLRDFGATVHQIGSVYAEALAASVAHQAETGAIAIHAYDQAEVLAGAGTLAREFDQQIPDLDAIVVACGGGGLSGGLATWFGDRLPMVVTETDGTATFASAVAAGGPTPIEVSGSAADALGATQLGELGWRALQSGDARSALVTDDETRAAQDLLWNRFRLLVEPAAATPLAILTSARWPLPEARSIGVVICGANLSRS